MALPKRTKVVSLEFSRKALIYDISNCAYVEGDVMPTDDEHAKHQVFDVAEDGNIDRVTRILDLAHAECVEMMYPYTKIECEEVEQMDNTLKETEVYVIRLLVPDDMAKSTITLINKLVHEYMVNRVLADWLSITKPSSKANWEEKLDNIKDEIRTRLNARCLRVRRVQTPF